MNEKNERKDWCRLPYALLHDKRLTSADVIVYTVLTDVLHDGRTDIKQTDIAELTGLCERQVKYSLARLKETGYILSKSTDGRKLFIELKQVLPPLKPSKKSKPEAPAPEGQEEERKSYPSQSKDEALKNVLAGRLKVKTQSYVDGVYRDLKAEAEARVKDPGKVYAYLSTMISTYVDNSDGFDADEYEFCINRFD